MAEILARDTNRAFMGILQIPAEMARIFPDALLMGVGFFSLITLSFPYFVFFVALLESLLVFHGLRSLNSHFNFIDTKVSGFAQSKTCRSGFSDLTMHTLSMFGSGILSGFPSSALYTVSVACTYIISSMMNFSAELQLLGEDATSKWWTSVISSTLLIISLVLYRVTYNCDTFINLIVSIFIGVLVGSLLVLQNSKLFGLSSLNILGVPILKQRTADGSTLYVCPR
jgi:hypothetical protein